MVSPLLDRMKVDIQRRAEVLPAEVQRWKDVANQFTGDPNKTVGKNGIYQSQIEALKLMMDELHQRQTTLVNELLPTATPGVFATGYLKLSDEIVSSHEIWRIFRYIIGLHQDQNLGPLVDAAGLIARDCYLTCMNKARDWNLVDETQFRAPPLVYLEAEMSPSTASRGYAAESIGFPLRRYKHMRLPIPLILVPSDNASSMWMLSTLHHEVGHNLDQDLKLQQDLSGPFLTALTNKGVPDERQKQWYRWISEILADAFGILLGGAGFAHALSWWLLVLAPDQKFQTLNENDVHPPYYLRVHLLAAMLRWFKIKALDDAAALIMQTWDATPKPDWVTPYTGETDLVAEFFFTEKLPALGQRSIRELGPDMADDARRVDDLERYLRTGLAAPDPLLPASASWRHVPSAAQIAFVTQPNPSTEKLDGLQQRAFLYLAGIPRPNKMSGGTGTPDFFRKLMRDLTFS